MHVDLVVHGPRQSTCLPEHSTNPLYLSEYGTVHWHGCILFMDYINRRLHLIILQELTTELERGFFARAKQINCL